MPEAAVSVRAPETRRSLPPPLWRWAAALWRLALLSRDDLPAASQLPAATEAVAASHRRAQGKEDAQALVDRLYQEHARAVLAYLCARLPALPDAEDALADVFLAALAQCATGEPPGIGWLLTVARRRVADFYRRRRTTADLPASFAAAASAEPEEHALRAEELREVIARVALLPEDQREALALRFAAGMRSPQIAAVLGKSEEATRALLSRALRRLRKELAQ